MTTTNLVIYRRFSTDEQEQGDSLARQSRNCEAFAQQRGWTVSDTLTDKGRSAFKGEHLWSDAELGKFVADVERGDVRPGTILLAERLDRLSRRPVAEAMAWIFNLTSRGIRIAIADKGKVFGERMGLEEFLGAALSLNTGNEESEKKSERVRAAKAAMWAKAERREGKWTNLANRPPLWLMRNETRDGWIIDKDREATIREVYGWAADGLGVTKIVRRLNARREKAWGVWCKKPGDTTWGRTAVRQLLQNPAVEGDFVPEKGMFEGKRLTGFYPRIVDADVVARARAGRCSRQKAKGRRASTGSASIFAGLTVCGECGRAAFLTSNQKKGKTYRYLRCEGAADARACQNTDYYPYGPFETAALDLCVDLALDDRFFEARGELRELQVREAELEKLIGERMTQREKMMRTFDEDDDQAKDLMRKLKVDINGFKAQLAETKAGIEKASGKVGAVEHLRRVNDIREAANSDEPLEREHARAKLRQAFTGITNLVSIERQHGRKVFTLSLKGGVMGVQIDTAGAVLGTVTHAFGEPLWRALSAENRFVLEPLIKRVEARVGGCA